LVVTESTVLAADGVTVVSRTIDNGDGTGTEIVYDVDGSVIRTDQLTGLPIVTYGPLDAAGALATLLVVEGVLPIEDAANSQHTTPGHLVAEAEAWALG
jgi:hypothetical protein